MLPALAEIDDLADWLGNPMVADTDHEARAAAVLRAASASVRRAAGETWVDENGDLDAVPEHVWSLTLQIAARMWANPTGARQQATGPFSTTFEPPVLTDEEISQLTGPKRTAHGGVWTLSTTRGEVETRRVLPYYDGHPDPVPVIGETRGLPADMP
jgi:hypothetical protein